ncbi:hypothetical protein SAMN05421869_114182 [Nonomuraea jiangxiensis]|uniref:Uncharacterized protein n=1 Tax=Nonomuraea jiangxiensis TaxID=633440 RepID=A0A1G8ZTZ6_9ACTN|nr:hypothetical protein SAMN05421869_114182 [Nonomuraea jiangxiensis]
MFLSLSVEEQLLLTQQLLLLLDVLTKMRHLG